MSQVKFKCDASEQIRQRHPRCTRVEVVAGWDRPIRGYHMTVYDLTTDPHDEIIVWCNLDHFDFPGIASNTEPLKRVLKEFNIDVPAEFWARVELNEGNVFHTFDGTNWYVQNI